MTSFKKQLAAFSQVSLFGCGVKSCSSNPRFTWFEGGHCPIIPKAVGSWQKANLSGSPLKGASSKKTNVTSARRMCQPIFLWPCGKGGELNSLRWNVVRYGRCCDGAFPTNRLVDRMINVDIFTSTNRLNQGNKRYISHIYAMMLWGK